jgi:hypothetical protein
MKTSLRFLTAPLLALGLFFLTHSTSSAGTFKHITIDGAFADWAGVPVAATDDEGDAGEGFDLRDIYVANDDQYLYFMVKIYPSSTNANYTQFHHHFFIDSDNDPSTGFGGAEMAVEDGYAFSQRYGANWSDGSVTGLDSAQAPHGELPSFQYEYRVSRAVRDTQPADVPAGSGNPERDLPVFTQDTIGIRWDVLTKNWSAQDAGPSFVYDMALAPPVFNGTQVLLGLTATSWNVNDAGTDLGTDWLAADYDDAQAGWKSGTGLFGFNAPAGVYPAPINTTVSSGRSVYYLRTHFAWNYDLNGVGFLVSNYLSAGAVFYLNGSEIKRVRMPSGTISYNTPATGGPSQPGTVELIDLPAGAMVVGDNVLAVEVHPAAGASSSLVFGCSLTVSDSFPPRLQDPTQPTDRTVTEGQPTTFSAGEVAGTGPFTYQWSKDGAPIVDATNAVFNLDSVVQSDAGQYSVQITNPKGVMVSSRAAVLTTTAVPVTLTNPSLPANQTVAEGASVTFAVDAAGTLLTYQWYQGDTAIEGANGPQLTLNNLSLADSGSQYSVTVSNRLNSVTSRKATLTVVNDTTPPGITSAAGGGRHIRISFAEPVDPDSAQQAANYVMDGGVQVQTAELDPASDNAVTLTTTTQTFGQPYKLSVNGVKDLYGNASHTEFRFRSTILIDGDLADWNDVPVALTQEQLNPGKIEFKDLSITNDADFIYVRFSFYEPSGPLASANWASLGNYFQVVFDTDANPATGGWNGSEVMNEVTSLFRLGGDWTDGNFVGGDTALGPAEVTATNFEFRVSLRATHERDHKLAFPNPTISVFCVIRDTSWNQLDITDFNPPVTYSIATVPSLDVTITAKRVGNKIELTWPGGGTLETCANLTNGSWITVPGATTGIQIDPTGAAGFYRVRQ